MYHLAKGVFDILPQDAEPWRSSYLWQYLEAKIRALANCYGYREIRTPLFESTDLFIRGVGGETDIVSKEMYTFEDKGGRSLTLRPEGTAPVMRAFIEKNLAEQAAVHKFFYIGPMFRYERQQAGRYRQHHQWGVEAIGSASPFTDVEVIDLLFSFLTRLGITGLTLQINSLGKKEDRQNYIARVKEFLSPHLSDLSEDSQRRFNTNPLRILDSKDERDQPHLKNVPALIDHLSAASKEHFDHVLNLLSQRNIPFNINPRLVRGLDYYNDTVFEITSQNLGSQNSLGGGGRYDGLMHQLGGANLPAFGYGCGLERILQTIINQGLSLPSPPVTTLLFIPMDTTSAEKTFQWVCHLRDRGISCDMQVSGRRLKALLKQASDQKIPFVVIVGEQELATGRIELKEMSTGTTTSLTFQELEHRLNPCKL